MITTHCKPKMVVVSVAVMVARWSGAGDSNSSLMKAATAVLRVYAYPRSHSTEEHHQPQCWTCFRLNLYRAWK
ncbi:hypothetical protein R6Q59_006479 [Mikania micrantha]